MVKYHWRKYVQGKDINRIIDKAYAATTDLIFLSEPEQIDL